MYWRVIYPGSWLIRWTWLRAVKARAEAPGTHAGTEPGDQPPDATAVRGRGAPVIWMGSNPTALELSIEPVLG